MQINNPTDLEIQLDLDLAWRLREVSAIRSTISRATRGTDRNATLRAAVPLLYAHWEGYIKRAAELYVHHIFSQNLKVGAVRIPIAGFFLEPAYIGSGGYSSSFGSRRALEFYEDNINRTMRSRKVVGINTESNLRYKVLAKITSDLNLEDFLPCADENAIDKNLCDKRNNIAHGQSVPISEEDFEDCRTYISDLMRSFKNRVVTAASNQEYVR